MDALRILSTVGPSLHAALKPQLVSLLPGVAACCAHSSRAVQAAAATCVLSLVKAQPAAILPTLLRCAASYANCSCTSKQADRKITIAALSLMLCLRTAQT